MYKKYSHRKETKNLTCTYFQRSIKFQEKQRNSKFPSPANSKSESFTSAYATKSSESNLKKGNCSKRKRDRKRKCGPN